APLGRGSTGRSVPKTDQERQVLRLVKDYPEEGTVVPLRKGEITDPRWPEEGWVKMEFVLDGVNIHYLRNQITGWVDDFKFKE
ncbi:MAG TPA: hypothetical protein VLL08_01575, partial [Kineosporiaceae bacterium]|nr:hypothetical protein [Kineosporiaceae bacterium]